MTDCATQRREHIMGTTRELRWGRCTLRTEELDPITRRSQRVEPQIELYAYTDSEQARCIKLTDLEALKLAHDLLEQIMRARSIRADRARRATPVAPTGDVSGSAL